MPSVVTVEVLPGIPDNPQFVQIDCTGLDPGRGTLEFRINGVIRASLPIDVVGGAVLLYIVPPGQIRNALKPLGFGSANFVERGVVDTILFLGDGSNGNSIELRYIP